MAAPRCERPTRPHAAPRLCPSHPCACATSSGACDEHTLRRNEQAFDELALRYRVLVDVSARSTACSLLGLQLSMPVLVAPTAFQRMAHPEGELATARAAAAVGSAMVLSTLSNTPVEEVATAAPDALWFQLYVYRDRGATQALVERVRAAGARALVLTVDAPLLGRRERDVKNGFALPEGLVIANAHARTEREVRAQHGGSGLAEYFASLLDPSVTFRDLEWLCAVAGMPVLVKGVVRGDDALRALEHGAAGVIVSNHGGRQLDGSLATIEALPEVVRAVAGRAPVLLDSGPRRCCWGDPFFGASPAQAKPACSRSWPCCTRSSTSRWRWPAAPRWPRSRPIWWCAEGCEAGLRRAGREPSLLARRRAMLRPDR